MVICKDCKSCQKAGPPSEWICIRSSISTTNPVDGTVISTPVTCREARALGQSCGLSGYWWQAKFEETP
jgi:hypothetical protein